MPSDEGIHLVVTDKNGRIYVNRLSIESTDDNIKSATISRMLDVDENVKPFLARMGHVVGGVSYRNRLAMIGGSHGCGFRWEPNRCTIIDADTKAGRIDEVCVLGFCMKLFSSDCRTIAAIWLFRIAFECTTR